MAKGLWYYFDKPFEKGHKCGFKELEIFIVDIIDFEDDELEEPYKEGCSLEAVHNVLVQALNSNQTIRVFGLVHKRPIHILIDTRSTHI